nr:hypothetical protein B0A51_02483 [Rachicladosporium sp. CCFEE 5018]
MSTYHVATAALCRHDAYTDGCPVCIYLNMQDSWQEAYRETRKSMTLTSVASQALSDETTQAIAAGIDVLTDDNGETPAGRRFRIEEERSDAWEARMAAIGDALPGLKTRYEDIREGLKPEEVEQAYADATAEALEEFRTINPGGFMTFEPEDPNFEGNGDVLDLSKIPATQDCLILEGPGLWLYLHAGRNRVSPRLPKDAVGAQEGPAIMSHGRAHENFRPYIGASEDEATDSSPADEDLATALCSDLEKSSLSETTRPRTERELRDRNSTAITIRLDASKDVWEEILGAAKYAFFLRVLCPQYVALVFAKHSGSSLYRYEGWPPVQESDPTFEGFVNWIIDCRAAQAKLVFRSKTVVAWTTNAKARTDQLMHIFTKKLNVIMGYTDASLALGNPLDYYHGAKSLLFYDGTKLGLNMKPTKR